MAVLQYLSIPFVCAFIGWITNKICILMTLRPVEFVGIKEPYLGWQGIVPRRAGEVAQSLVDIFSNRLIDLKELFGHIEPDELIDALEPHLHEIVRDIVDNLMTERAPDVWVALPLPVQERLYLEVEKKAPDAIRRMVTRIGDNIEDVFDLEAMLMDIFVKDRRLLVDVFEEIGYKEFQFVINSGGKFGFLFGTIQMLLWMFYPVAWILPVAGVFVGTFTNYLAIHMVFEPTHAKQIGPFSLLGKKLGPWILQGLFIKRRKEVAVDLGKVFAKEIMSPENMTAAMLKGPSSDELFHLIDQEIKFTMDQQIGFAKPFVTLTVGTQRYIAIRDRVVDQVIQKIPFTMARLHDYTEQAIDIENLLEEKMAEMTEEEFAGIMRPIFQKDEWKLVALGAVLGLLIGLGQLYWVWGGQL